VSTLVAFRVDGVAAIGSGHVFRCLTLADALRRRGARCVFICRHLAPGLAARIEARGHLLRRLGTAAPVAAAAPAGPAAWFGADWQTDAADTAAVIAGLDPVPRWLVVDHYLLDAGWEGALRPAVQGILAIDDLADRAHAGDVLLDQNLQDSPQDRYAGKLAATCRTLLGPRYALLREEFAAVRSVPPPVAAVRRILVSMGGADLGDATGRALKACLELADPGLEVELVVGADYPHLAALREAARVHLRVDIAVAVDDLAVRLSRAAIAVGAGGISMWERCCVGVPMVNIAIAANQEEGAAALGRAGAALYLGRAAELGADDLRAALSTLLRSDTLREALRERALALVDGCGADRVADLLLPQVVDIRPATADDCGRIFAWRNDPATRMHFFDTSAIDRERHDHWFARVLADPARRLLVAERNGEALAVVRYDIDGASAEISVYLVPGKAGRGLGRVVIDCADRWLARQCPQVATLRARVLPANPRSGAAFAAAGYRDDHRVFVKRLGATGGTTAELESK
jgi:UDP-2,4-diacetamido-2,4,6-trideoxy-beta-L-altropyranose hydrolase